MISERSNGIYFIAEVRIQQKLNELFLKLVYQLCHYLQFFRVTFFQSAAVQFLLNGVLRTIMKSIFCYLSSHLIVNDFCYFCVSIRGNFFRGLFPLNTPPLTPKNNFSNFCFLEFESQSYNKHSQNFVIRNLQINLLAQ